MGGMRKVGKEYMWVTCAWGIDHPRFDGGQEKKLEELPASPPMGICTQVKWRVL